MAAVYKHKVHGFQIRYRVFFNQRDVVKYRYSQSRDEANELLRVAEILERGSRRGDLRSREVELIRNLGLLTGEEVREITNGTVAILYDLDAVVSQWQRSSSLANSPYGHVVNTRRGEQLVGWLRSHPIPTLTIADVKRYLHDRREGFLVFRHPVTGYAKATISPKTLMNELQILRDIIDEAVSLGMVEKNVAREVDWSVRNQKLRRALSMEEVSAIMAEAKKNRHLCHGYAYEMICVALYSGLRRQEIRTLKWADVDLKSRKFYIQGKAVPGEADFTPKGGRAGTTTIPDLLAEVLEGMERKGEWVFGGSKPIVAHRFYRTFKVLVERAGLPPELSLHHARHTYGSWLLRQTGDLSYVQSEMRHADIATTKNYLHTIHGNTPAKSFSYGLPIPPDDKEV